MSEHPEQPQQPSEKEVKQAALEAKDQQEAADTTTSPPTALRITCPGGRKVTLEVPPDTTTVGDLKARLEKEGGTTTTPAVYLRLLCRGKKLDDESATLATLGIKHRTALMALHNEHYAQDQAGIVAIEKILQEAEALKNDPTVAANVVHERVTQLCCQLDAVDTQGSATLRQFRKDALAHVQAMEDKQQSIEDASVNKDKQETVHE